MLSVCLFVSIGVFLSYFFDIVHCACEKSNKNPLNIKQKYRPNPSGRFAIKKHPHHLFMNKIFDGDVLLLAVSRQRLVGVFSDIF